MAEGFKNFVAAAVLGESDLDDYLMSQTVMRFADAAARDAALTEVEGMIVYLKDVNTLQVYDGTSWWTVGSARKTLTTPASDFISQGANPTFTVNVSEYKIENGICDWWFNLTVTSAGTAGTAFYVNLPVTADNVSRTIGSGYVFDASVPTVDTGVWQIPAALATRMSFFCSRSTGTYWGVTPNLALANGDILDGHVRFVVDAAA